MIDAPLLATLFVGGTAVAGFAVYRVLSAKGRSRSGDSAGDSWSGDARYADHSGHHGGDSGHGGSDGGSDGGGDGGGSSH
jgi:hypothetical protein